MAVRERGERPDKEPGMAQSKYVLLANDGSSHDCSKKALFDRTSFDLADLLEEGWRPVHETPMGQCAFYDDDGNAWEFTCVLILLTKDE
jgi:hypothetical protein